MIPDKIYFGFDEETHLESYCLEKKGKCQSEYIRKDALLEWAKEQIKAMEDFPQPYNYLHGRIAAMNDLIDFIDSLEKQPAAEICPRCKYHNKKDGYCYEPHGGTKSRINENGVYDCTGFIEEDKK